MDATPSDAATIPDEGPDAHIGLPDGVYGTDRVVNIVDPEVAARVTGFLVNQDDGLAVATRAFYERFADEYDFLYVFTEAEVPNAPGGVFRHVRVPDIPEIGLSPREFPEFGSEARLRGAIAVNSYTGGNGPTIHETFHYWSMFLDRRFGFGVDADNDFGNHWGLAGVLGQHGGFDPGTVECLDPAGQPPPCAVGEDGKQRLSIAAFGPTANGGDGLPFAPIELYLLGVLPAAEVPSPFMVIEGGHFEMFDEATQRLHFTVDGVREVSMDEIVAFHGERPPATDEERSFRGVFVVFSAAPLPEADLQRLDTWARIFAGDQPSDFLESFESATGGEITLRIAVGAVR